MTAPTHPAGTVENYTDALARVQTAVDGPKGHVLVTRDNRFEPYKVWRSDEAFATFIRTTDYKRAVRTACVAVGLDPAGLVWPAEPSPVDTAR